MADDRVGDGATARWTNPLADEAQNFGVDLGDPEMQDNIGADVNDKRLHLRSLDVDSLSYSTTELKANIEREWLNKLKPRFMRAYEKKYEAPWGVSSAAWGGQPLNEIEDDWNDQVEKWRQHTLSPFQIETIRWGKPKKTTATPQFGREISDGDLENLVQTRLFVVTLRKVEAQKWEKLPTGVERMITTGDIDKPEAKKKSVNMWFKDLIVKCRGPVQDQDATITMFLMPLRFRVPTTLRLNADESSDQLTGGVTAVKVITWDLAIIWPQIERDPDNTHAYDRMKREAKQEKVEVHSTGVNTKSDEKRVVKLFEELRGAHVGDKKKTVAHLFAADISRWVDKVEINKARATCQRWREDGEAERATRAEDILNKLEEKLRTMDKEAGFFGEQLDTHAATCRDVERLMVEALSTKAFELTAAGLSVMLDERRMGRILERAEEADKIQHRALESTARMLKLALVQVSSSTAWFLLRFHHNGCRETAAAGVTDHCDCWLVSLMAV